MEEKSCTGSGKIKINDEAKNTDMKLLAEQ